MEDRATAAAGNGYAPSWPAAPVWTLPQQDDPGQSCTPQDRLRAAWDAHRQKVLYGIAAAVLLSTAASFYESFTGLMGWFERLGFRGLRAIVAPAMVDLVGVTGETIALVVIIDGRGGKMVRVLAWFAFSWGLVLSVVGNAGRDGFRPGLGGWFDMAWFAVPPLSLAIITSAALALAKLLLKPAAADDGTDDRPAVTRQPATAVTAVTRPAVTRPRKAPRQQLTRKRAEELAAAEGVSVSTIYRRNRKAGSKP